MKTHHRHAALQAQSQSYPAAMTGVGNHSSSVLALVCLLLLHAAVASAGVIGSGYARVYARAYGYNDVTQNYQTEEFYTEIPSGSVNTGLFGAGASYGRANVQAQASSNFASDFKSGSFSGSAFAGAAATGMGKYVDLQGFSLGRSVINFSQDGNGPTMPFLFKATMSCSTLGGDGSAGINLYGANPAGWSGFENVNHQGPTSLSVAGIDTGIGMLGESRGTVQLNQDGVVNANGSHSGSVQIDLNVVMPPGSRTVLAAPGHTDAVVNYPARTTYTGLTEAQFTNVDSITYNPPSGSTFAAGSTNVTSTVHYKWGVTITETFYVRVIPGFAPADIVRVSWNGQPVRVFYDSPALPAGTVSNVQFSPQSGFQFPVGETTVLVDASIPNQGLYTRTFKVTVLNGSTWSSSGPPANLQGDTDHDGQPDWLEAQAGTDPNDPADRFGVQTMERVGDDFRVSWLGTGGVTYQLQSIALTGGTPVSIGPPLTAAGARQLLTVTDPGALTAQTSKFYRVVALAQ